MEYYYLCSSEIEHNIDRTIRRTMLPRLKINFNVCSHFQDFNDEYSDQKDAPSIATEDYSSSAYVTSQESLPYDHVREAVGKAISELHYGEYERASIIELMVREVWDIFSAGEIPLKHTVWTLDLEIRMKRRWRHHVVDKYEIERYREAGGCCCICLEEFGCDDMRMPCSHVFHEGCIKEWRRTSQYEGRVKEWQRAGQYEGRIKEWRRTTSHYYCPVCRCEMPLDIYRHIRVVN